MAEDDNSSTGNGKIRGKTYTDWSFILFGTSFVFATGAGYLINWLVLQSGIYHELNSFSNISALFFILFGTAGFALSMVGVHYEESIYRTMIASILNMIIVLLAGRWIFMAV